jgi:hypothetical protein
MPCGALKLAKDNLFNGRDARSKGPNALRGTETAFLEHNVGRWPTGLWSSGSKAPNGLRGTETRNRTATARRNCRSVRVAKHLMPFGALKHLVVAQVFFHHPTKHAVEKKLMPFGALKHPLVGASRFDCAE